ncbi:hypothetical protein KNE206_65450 [Kitasatospora sp. NE20-6]
MVPDQQVHRDGGGDGLVQFPVQGGGVGLRFSEDQVDHAGIRTVHPCHLHDTTSGRSYRPWKGIRPGTW